MRYTLITTVNGADDSSVFRCPELAGVAFHEALAAGESPMFLGDAPDSVIETLETRHAAAVAYFQG